MYKVCAAAHGGTVFPESCTHKTTLIKEKVSQPVSTDVFCHGKFFKFNVTFCAAIVPTQKQNINLVPQQLYNNYYLVMLTLISEISTTTSLTMKGGGRDHSSCLIHNRNLWYEVHPLPTHTWHVSSFWFYDAFQNPNHILPKNHFILFRRRRQNYFHCPQHYKKWE